MHVKRGIINFLVVAFFVASSIETIVYANEESKRERGICFEEMCEYEIKNITEAKVNEAGNGTRMLDAEYYIKNLYTAIRVDETYPLFEFRRPAGKIVISENCEVVNSCSIGEIAFTRPVMDCLGFSISEKTTLEINWELETMRPLIIRIYPVVEVYAGELWEDDIWEDDKCTDFEVHRVVDYVVKFWVDTEAE